MRNQFFIDNETYQVMTQIFVRFPWAEIVLQALLSGLVVWFGMAIGRPILTRLCAPFPFFRRLLIYIFTPVRALFFLLMLELVLRNTAADTPNIGIAIDLTALAQALNLTIVLVRTISSVADTILELNPLDGADNLESRRIQTQTRVLARCLVALVVLVGVGLAFMTLPSMQKIGTSLLASAGVAGLAVGLAAKPIFSNLLAGIQLALTQPIRLDDVVIIQGEWGRIEEIKGTYVVVRIWDQRRLVVPLQWFIENPFENWTRNSAEILGTVFIWIDYRMPVSALRAAAERICKSEPDWDGRLVETVVTQAGKRAIEVRVLVSAADAGAAWQLRCRIREELIAFIQRDYPDCLPMTRLENGRWNPVSNTTQSGL